MTRIRNSCVVTALLVTVGAWACGPDTQDAICGNGTLEEDEACDDGNVEPGDGCSATCQIEDPCDACEHGCATDGTCFPECNPTIEPCCQGDGTHCEHGCNVGTACWPECNPDTDSCCTAFGTLCLHGCQPSGTCWPECNPGTDPCCEGDGTGTPFGPDPLCPSGQSCADGVCQPSCDTAEAAMGNIGCHFTVATPHFYIGIQPPCFAVLMTNTWTDPAVLTVSRGGQVYDVMAFGRMPTSNPNPTTWPAVPSTGIPPGESAVLYLSHDPASQNAGNPLTCPVAPAIGATGGSVVASSGIGAAWQIDSTTPVTMYDILPFGGADSYLPSAELLVPTTAWGTFTIAVLPPDSVGPPWGQVVAMADNTTVDILPTVDLPAAGSAPAAPANVVTSITLQAGEYVQWQLVAGQDMTGTAIVSDNPVAFTGGNAYICYTSATSSGGGCESAHQQIPPVSALGSEYVAPPYPTRGSAPESIFYRLVGAVDGTLLTYDPILTGAPAMLNAGEVADFETTAAFVVTSQDEDHPFYVAQTMAGNSVPGNVALIGDEEFVNILPPAQFLNSYSFYTDTEYATTLLVLVRVVTDSGFEEVTVDCYGQVTGWVPVGVGGRYEMTSIDLLRNGVPVSNCTNGLQQAYSEGPFGVMVWGLDYYASYAYPVGGSFAPINEVTPPL